MMMKWSLVRVRYCDWILCYKNK